MWLLRALTVCSGPTTFFREIDAGNNKANNHYTEGAELINCVLSATMVSSVSGVLSHFGLNVGELAGLSTTSLVFGKIPHFCHHGHTVGQMK